VSVGVLNDQAADAARITRGEVQPDCRPIVMQIEVERPGCDLRQQSADDIREVLERRPIDRRRGAEPRKIRRDDETLLGKITDHVAKHGRRTRKSVD
jgi:hypothetical protein